MHGADALLGMIVGGCFAAAFAIEIIINRRPIVVALTVPVLALLILIALDGEGAWRDGGLAAVLYAVWCMFGAIASAAGSGLARAILLWREALRDRDPHEPINGR